MRRSLKTILVCVVAILCAGTANAGLSPEQWYFGKWDCMNDGAAGEMEWRSRDVVSQTCNGDVCSSSVSTEIAGSYLYLPSGPAVALKRVDSNTSMLRMTGTDGNLWYLANKGKRAEGWAMRNGSRREFVCLRKGTGKARKKLYP